MSAYESPKFIAPSISEREADQAWANVEHVDHVKENIDGELVQDLSEDEDEDVITCPRCDGTGQDDCDECGGSGSIDCEDCSGMGEVEASTYGDSPDGTVLVNCRTCSGEGEEECDACGGTGSFDCERCEGEGEINTDE